MLDAARLLVFLHVAANLTWIGSILAVAVVLSADADPRARGLLGRAVYRRLAGPAFGVSLLTGTARLTLDLTYYLAQTRFMHPKLFLALVAIALHHVIGAQARRMESGAAMDAGQTASAAVALAVAAAGAAFLALVKPF